MACRIAAFITAYICWRVRRTVLRLVFQIGFSAFRTSTMLIRTHRAAIFSLSYTASQDTIYRI